MNRLIPGVILGALLLAGGPFSWAWSQDLKVIQTRKTKDAAITLKTQSGQWSKGRNDFILEFTSLKDKQPFDAGKVTLNTSMAMAGMAPMTAAATLTAGKAPGQYLGTIEFQDTGTREVTVSWDGPAGKGSVKFSMPVR